MSLTYHTRYVLYLSFILLAVFLSIWLVGEAFEAVQKDVPTANSPIATLLTMGSLVYGAHFAARFFSDREWRRRDIYFRIVRWTVADSFAVTFLFIALPILFSVLVSNPFETPGDKADFTVAQVAVGVFSSVVVYLFGISILRQRGATVAEAMGLRLGPYRRLILIGVIAFLAFQPLRFIHTAWMVAVFDKLNLSINAHPVVDQLTEPGAIDLKVALALSVGLAAPFFEEVFFRGFLYQALRKRLEPWAAILFTAVLFASVHPGFFQATLIFPLGVLLAYLMEKTGSLVPCIVVHFLLNGTSLVLTLLKTG
jgi:membrane protease YdiL (CAAX protease family)